MVAWTLCAKGYTGKEAARGTGTVERCFKILHPFWCFPPLRSRSGPNRLHCLGPLRERLTIWAAMDAIPAPTLVLGSNLPEESAGAECWPNTGGSSAGDAVSQSQMAPEEVRLATAEL